MTATLFLIVKIAILVAIAVWLADRPGTVEIVWQGYVIELSFGIFVLAIAVLMALSGLSYWLWRALARTPREIARGRVLARRERGYQALSDGLMAIAAGDGARARKESQRANALLDGPPLAMLLSAQAAQLNGDGKTAHDRYEQMLERPDTELLGLRGLLTEALHKQEWLAALDIVNRARRLKPEAPWVLRVALELEVRLRKWVDAQNTLALMVRAGIIDQGEAQRLRAAVLLERSREAEGAGALDRALDHASEAARQQPGLVPAVARAATLQGQLGRQRQGAKLVEKAWATQPHPDLAAAYRRLGGEDEDAVARTRRLEGLHQAAPQDAISLLTLAEAEMEARLYGAARAHLMQIADGNAHQQATRRVFRRLAELERAENDDDAAARAWLERATTAPPDPVWVCDSCGTVAPHWSAICGACGAFGTLSWRSPSEGTHLPATPSPAMLTAAAP